ncbi:MAG: transposase [Methylocella sp.]
MEPRAVASEVARAAGIHSSQLFRWRQQLCERVQIPAVFDPRAYPGERFSDYKRFDARIGKQDTSPSVIRNLSQKAAGCSAINQPLRDKKEAAKGIINNKM